MREGDVAARCSVGRVWWCAMARGFFLVRWVSHIRSGILQIQSEYGKHDTISCYLGSMLAFIILDFC